MARALRASRVVEARAALAACFLSALVTLAPARSDACAAAGARDAACAAPVIAPRPYAWIPANAPAVAAAPLEGEYTTLDLIGPDTRVVPTSRRAEGGALLLVPDAPLVPGGLYAVRYAMRCGGDARVYEPQQFTAGAAQALPALPAELSISSSQVETTARGTLAVARVRVSPTEAMKPWMAIARLRSTIDGEPWVERAWGEVPRDGVDVAVIASCDEHDGCGAIAPGRHRVVVIADIAGGPSIVSAPLDLTLDCAATREEEPPAALPSEPAGCGVTRAKGVALPIALVLGAIALSRRRRR